MYIDIKTALIMISVVLFLKFSWVIQEIFGNYLKHFWPKSKLRILWWSQCDIDGYCSFCLKDDSLE